MYRIAICIPTYKRPLMLKKLLLSIFESNKDESLINYINIIIVDNDSNKTAEIIVNQLKEIVPDFISLNYSNYPVKGLSNVRNELLRIALAVKPDFIDFIDDDEYVTSEWLNELLKTIINSKADAVRGPVLAITDERVPEHIWYWFKRERYSDGSQIQTFTTGNLLLKQSSLAKYNIWFDERFNLTGSEDFFFGIQIQKNGATIYWSDKAIVYENIPKDRVKAIWLLKRVFRGGANYVYVLKLEKQYLKLVTKTLTSFIYIIAGIVALTFLFLPIKKRLWGLLKIYEGIGGIGGLFNFKNYGY